MKIKLSVSDECYDEVKKFLTDHNIETDDESEYILIQKNKYPDRLSVRNIKTGAKQLVNVDNIVTIESYGHAVEVHTENDVYNTSERLYQLMNMLDPKNYIRVSNSVIVSKNMISEIIPTLSRKFILKMKNGDRVDVTRIYYNSFKETFQI